MRRWLRVSILILAGLVNLSEAAQVTKWLLGSQTTLLSTELNGLTNNSYTVVSATYNNIALGGAGDGSLFCDLEFAGTFVANPTANTAVSVWFLTSQDGGTNFENTPNASIALGRVPDIILPVTTGQPGTRVMRRILCPFGIFRAVLRNDGTGQNLTASGHTLKIRPVTTQGISQ
jgi:hypothetical protein